MVVVVACRDSLDSLVIPVDGALSGEDLCGCGEQSSAYTPKKRDQTCTAYGRDCHIERPDDLSTQSWSQRPAGQQTAQKRLKHLQQGS
jgi:hypothetical protein